MNNIRAIRNQKGFTQGDIAKETGLSKASISIFENGKSTPTVNSAFKISQVLGVTIDELFYSGYYEKEEV